MISQAGRRRSRKPGPRRGRKAPAGSLKGKYYPLATFVAVAKICSENKGGVENAEQRPTRAKVVADNQ